ncbi:hypothetical protein KUTeg_011780 [Tegillarca granosa]|uniref:Integrase p58-like C-terminal domain-containing protein n=1 Tax=Tegillarca granosa TaxID=220873 RepID=A0ABQ9F2V8_TEGGR|nr:hypothetical protein KUTeg_011780 [Tegillarca granosa]
MYSQREIICLTEMCLIGINDNSNMQNTNATLSAFECTCITIIRERLQKADRIARHNLDRATKRQKSHYDMKATMSKLKIGEAVYYMGVYRKEGVCPKLQPVYTGPHLIIQKINELNYKIQLDVNGSEKVVHIDKLKLYKNENLPKWLLKKQKEISSQCSILIRYLVNISSQCNILFRYRVNISSECNILIRYLVNISSQIL